ncbi:MAG: Hsp20/alpha crystallin family protein [Nitrospirae bacterium]|nr:Hsp20/alpha crystallin family protein [Nitrospirota bacterium]
MNRLFEETLARGSVREEVASGQWSPAVDILETEGDIILKAELPGIDLAAIDIQIRDNVLTLRGERALEDEVKKEHYYRIERSYGSFVRSFTLPSTIDQARVEAQLREGILEVKMPKRDSSPPRSITVEIT